MWIKYERTDEKKSRKIVENNKYDKKWLNIKINYRLLTVTVSS